MSQKYFRQYNMMKRWHYRIEHFSGESCGGLPGSLFKRDFYYAFFITCYHLKDWLKRDTLVKGKNIDVEEFVKKSNLLNTCGQLCNGSKHLIYQNLEKLKRQGYMKNIAGPGPTMAVINCKIDVNGKIYDAFKFITKCIQEWDKFLKDYTLPIPTGMETIYFNL